MQYPQGRVGAVRIVLAAEPCKSADQNPIGLLPLDRITGLHSRRRGAQEGHGPPLSHEDADGFTAEPHPPRASEPSSGLDLTYGQSAPLSSQVTESAATLIVSLVASSRALNTASGIDMPNRDERAAAFISASP